MQGLSLSRLDVSPLPPGLIQLCGGNEDDLFEADLLPQQTSPDKNRARLLVVDDAPDVLEMFGMLLRLSGYEVEVAVSAQEALELARAGQFDLIVSDIGMPGMSGYELAKSLRGLPGYVNVPMIAVTGYARYSDQTAALESGFNAHLSKPVHPTILLDLIEQLIK